MALVTIGLLVFSDEYSGTWRPLFGEALNAGVPWSAALLLVFLLDIGWVSILVVATGGSVISPFGSLFFLVPPLAIFLRESLGRIVLYLALVTVSFTINFASRDERSRIRGGPRRHAT
jgi:hypothetical protein